MEANQINSHFSQSMAYAGRLQLTALNSNKTNEQCLRSCH